jgi:DNA-binding MarR family transcriptional regulator
MTWVVNEISPRMVLEANKAIEAGAPARDVLRRALDAAPRPERGLTPRQRHVLSYLIDREQAGQPTPSFQEIADALGVTSRSQIARYLDCLEQRGYITRQPAGARSIRVIARPQEQGGQDDGR